MYAFRQRPLTWLFVIATLCVDAVAATYQFPAAAVMAMFFGQAFVVGGWLALGGAHRLFRAAVFIVVLMVQTLISTLIPLAVLGRGFAQFEKHELC